MTNSETLDRLLALARDRLQSLPGGFSAFQRTISNTLEGQAIQVMACELPFVTKVAAEMGNRNAWSEIDAHLITVIDSWAANCTVPAPITEPMTIARPDGKASPVIRKRAALVAEVKNIWPTIEQDLSDSGRNGLNNAAKLPKHGDWDLTKATGWAVEKGKITKQKAAQFIATNPDSVLLSTLQQLYNL